MPTPSPVSPAPSGSDRIASRLHHATREVSRRHGLASSLLALVIAVGILLGMAVDLYFSYRKEQQHAQATTANLARILDEHLVAVLGKIDVALQSAVLELEGRLPEGGSARVNARLARLLATIPESQSLRIAGADGRFLFDATGKPGAVSIADRQYFLRNKKDPDAGLVVSEPIFARLTNNWVITLSRQLRDERGRFLGLVQAAVRADYFDALYRELHQENGASLAIRDRELRLFVRKPDEGAPLGQATASPELRHALAEGQGAGFFSTRSTVDQVERLYAFRMLTDYPFIITTGLSNDYIYGEWRRKCQMYALLGVLLLACLILAERLWRLRYRKAFELAEVMTAQAMATEASLQQTRRRLLSNLGHELRTPLNGILGMAQILQAAGLPESQQQQVQVIEESGQRLLRIVGMIGKYMQLDANEYPIRAEPLGLAEVMTALDRRFTPLAAAHGLSLRLAPLPDGVSVVRGDVASLQYILAALLDNACKFTPAGGIELAVTVVEQQADEVLLRFTVSDSGIGISPADRERLFQPFTPLDDSPARHSDGLGFELALCQRLAEAMRGKLGVSSAGVGLGTSFWLEIRLPLVVLEPLPE